MRENLKTMDNDNPFNKIIIKIYNFIASPDIIMIFNNNNYSMFLFCRYVKKKNHLSHTTKYFQIVSR